MGTIETVPLTVSPRGQFYHEKKYITKQFHVFRRIMNHPGTANYYNWTIDFRDMNYSAGKEDLDDFDPSRCGHVDEHYSQVRMDLAGQIVSDIQPYLIWEEVSVRDSGVLADLQRLKGSKNDSFLQGVSDFANQNWIARLLLGSKELTLKYIPSF